MAKKLEEIKVLGAFMVRALKEIKEKSEDELKALFQALKVEDVEQIEDAKIYCLASDKEFNNRELEQVIEDLESVLKDLAKIKI